MACGPDTDERLQFGVYYYAASRLGFKSMHPPLDTNYEASAKRNRWPLTQFWTKWLQNSLAALKSCAFHFSSPWRLL